MAELLTVRETARLLGVHENTIRNWSNEGILTPIYRYPGAFRQFSSVEINRKQQEMHIREAQVAGQHTLHITLDVDRVDFQVECHAPAMSICRQECSERCNSEVYPCYSVEEKIVNGKVTWAEREHTMVDGECNAELMMNDEMPSVIPELYCGKTPPGGLKLYDGMPIAVTWSETEWQWEEIKP
jgi:hypothetical protein